MGANERQEAATSIKNNIAKEKAATETKTAAKGAAPAAKLAASEKKVAKEKVAAEKKTPAKRAAPADKLAGAEKETAEEDEVIDDGELEIEGDANERQEAAT